MTENTPEGTFVGTRKPYKQRSLSDFLELKNILGGVELYEESNYIGIELRTTCKTICYSRQEMLS